MERENFEGTAIINDVDVIKEMNERWPDGAPTLIEIFTEIRDETEIGDAFQVGFNMGDAQTIIKQTLMAISEHFHDPALVAATANLVGYVYEVQSQEPHPEAKEGILIAIKYVLDKCGVDMEYKIREEEDTSDENIEREG